MVIEGVMVKKLNKIADERGWLMEILRCDENIFKKFGQVYLTTAYPGVVKAWHFHKNQTDNFACINGMMKVALYDDRKNSKTKGEINEFFIGDENPALITVPPGIYHGFKAIGKNIAYFLNITDLPYNHKNPDEFRLPPDTNKISYNWILTPGEKHG